MKIINDEDYDLQDVKINTRNIFVLDNANTNCDGDIKEDENKPKNACPNNTLAMPLYVALAKQ